MSVVSNMSVDVFELDAQKQLKRVRWFGRCHRIMKCVFHDGRFWCET